MKKLAFLLTIGAQTVLLHSFAADTVISSDTTTAQTVDASSTLTVNEGVTLSLSTPSTSSTAVTLNDSSNVVNNGDITVNVTGADNVGLGVFSNSNANSVTNSGNITVTSTGAGASTGPTNGIAAGILFTKTDGDGNLYVTNTGTISVSSDALARNGTDPNFTYNSVYGIRSLYGNSTYITDITNSNLISISSSSSIVGIDAASYASVKNPGTISITKTGSGGGGTSAAVSFEGSNNTFENSGSINMNTTGPSATWAVSATGDGNVIENSGSINIYAPETLAEGITVNGNNNIVTNRGDILITGSSLTTSGRWAIGFTGNYNDQNANTGNTLNFYTQSTVAGAILFGTSATGNAFNIIDGGLDREYVINYEGNTSVNIGSTLLGMHNATTKQIATFNKTEHARANEMSSDITGSINNIIYNRVISSSNSGDNKSLKGCRICACNPYQTTKNNSWVKFIGNYGEQPAYQSKGLISSKSYYGGVVAGYETFSDELDMDIGFYAGATHGKQDFNDSDIKVKSSNLLFGVYTSNEIDNDTFLSFTLGGGYQYKDRDRKVYNNLTASGTETMKSNAHSFFISPGINLAYVHNLDDQWSIIPSLSVNYVNETTGEYEEKNGRSDSRQTVESRFIGTLNSRMQLNVRKSLNISNDYVDMYAGLEHRSLLHGKKVTIKAIGTEGEFDVSGVSQLTKAILGGRYSRTFKNGMQSFVSVEVSKGLKKSKFKNNLSGSINAGVSFNF